MRIASLAPSNTEIIYALEMQEDLVATTSLCDHPQAARKVNSVGGWSSGMNIEELRDIEPDLVLASDALQDDIVEQIDFAEVFHLKPESMEEVYESILKIGEITSSPDRAEEIVKEMQSQIGQIEVADSPRIYCEEWSDPPMVSGNWIPGLLEIAGFEYMIEEGKRSRKIREGEVQDFDPEIIVMNICGAGENFSRSEIMERSGWSEISAVRDGNVHVIDDSLLNRPGPRLVEGARWIARRWKNKNRQR